MPVPPKARATGAFRYPSSAVLHVDKLTTNINELHGWAVATLDDDLFRDARCSVISVVREVLDTEKLRIVLAVRLEQLVLLSRRTCMLEGSRNNRRLSRRDEWGVKSG